MTRHIPLSEDAMEKLERRYAELVELKNKYFQCKENVKSLQSKPTHMMSSEKHTKLRCVYSVAMEKLKQAETALREFANRDE